VSDDRASLHVKISGILCAKAFLYDLSEGVLACFLPFQLGSFQLFSFPHLLIVIKIILPTEIFATIVSAVVLLILLFLFFLADDFGGKLDGKGVKLAD
jgi:hypothetical protein